MHRRHRRAAHKRGDDRYDLSLIRNNDLWVMGAADLFSRLTSTLSPVGQPLVLLSEVSVNWRGILLLIIVPNLSAPA